jgi:hypothetical protein
MSVEVAGKLKNLLTRQAELSQNRYKLNKNVDRAALQRHFQQRLQTARSTPVTLDKLHSLVSQLENEGERTAEFTKWAGTASAVFKNKADLTRIKQTCSGLISKLKSFQDTVEKARQVKPFTPAFEKYSAIVPTQIVEKHKKNYEKGMTQFVPQFLANIPKPTENIAGSLESTVIKPT